MVRLVYSNRTEDLLAELAARVRAQQERDGPLVPVTVIVPSAGVEGYLRLGIAREGGVAANVEYARLARFAADLVADLSGARVADASAIGAMALSLLLDDGALAAPELAPVRGYLAGAGGDRDSEDARRIQLALRIGRTFEEYTHSRGDLLASWDAGPALGGEHAEVERWQRRAWLAMFGPGGLIERRADPRLGPWVPLHRAVAALEPAARSAPSAVHVFGLSHVARTFRELFARLARVAEIVVYAVSPCEGFWEDADAGDPAPLRLWGRPGREHVRALNELAAFDHDDRFVDPVDASRPATRTLLHRVQRDLLRRTPRAPDPPAPADGSIVVLEHASVRREIEAVASEIWRLVEADPSLRFDDVAVVVPDADVDRYAVQIAAVFGEAHDLPHRTEGAALRRESAVAEAIDLLLGLPLGRFTRQDVLGAASHPAVAASIDDVDPRCWAAWCEELGVVRGVDRLDHADTYVRRDILNWDQGLRRLALGAFMAGDASGEARPFDLEGEQYVPYETGASELRDAAGLGLLARSLLADARFARDAELTMPEWAAFLRALVETYVTPSGAAEEEHLARCLRRVHAIGAIDVGVARVRYRIALEVARESLSKLRASASGGGVLVSTIAAVRPLPFRVVFACGMGEGKFPSPESDDPLDLRWAARRAGDVSAHERDKHGFLEALIGARDRLYLSYVSRDPLTGEALEPSSLVHDLLVFLGSGYAADPRALRVSHPLRRWDPRYFPELFGPPGPDRARLGEVGLPEARAEARTLALRRSLDASGAAVGRDTILDRAGADPAWGALASHLGIARLPEAAPPSGRVFVPIHAILKFLELPLQGWARFRVGLDEADDADADAREDEIFETAPRDETLFLRQVLRASARQGCAIERAYDDAVRARELRGRGPSGVFASAERAAHLGVLDAWRSGLAAQGLEPDEIQVHRFGRGGEHSDVDEVHEPLVIDVEVLGPRGVSSVVQAEIGGRTLPAGRGMTDSITLSKRAVEGKANESRKDSWAAAGRERAALRAFVDHAVLSAAGVTSSRARASVSVIATPTGPLTDRVAFEPLSPGEATRWLRAVVRDLLEGTHAYFLPCEAVFARAAMDPDGPVSPFVEKARAMGSALRSTYGPVPRPQTYPAPDEPAARAMVSRRFGAYFAKRRAPAEAP